MTSMQLLFFFVAITVIVLGMLLFDHGPLASPLSRLSCTPFRASGQRSSLFLLLCGHSLVGRATVEEPVSRGDRAHAMVDPSRLVERISSCL